MIYNIYTDGSTKGKIGTEDTYGGWAFACVETGYQKAEGKASTTNNEMELTAIKHAIDYCFEIKKQDPSAIFNIHSDSSYSINCITKWCHAWSKNGWINSSKQEVANKEIIQYIYDKLRFASNINFIKVAGHTGVEYNELVDKLACNEALKLIDNKIRSSDNE